MPTPAPLVVRLLLTLGLAAGVAGGAAVLTPPTASDAVAEPPLVATPQAPCRPGSRPEPGAQGRVPAADFASGRAAEGYTCNASVVSSVPLPGGFKTLRYVDRRGQVCAFFDTGTVGLDDVVPSEASGVVVLDMTDPRAPRRTANLTSPAMLTPHESLVLNERRGLLAAVAGNLMTKPGVLDLYDVATDCRQPRLLSSLPVAGLGHESGFAPDGRTFYASSTFGQVITAVDVADPEQPRPITSLLGVNVHGMRLSPDGRTLYAAELGNPSGPSSTYANGGLRIFDVSSIQSREPQARFEPLSALRWASGSIPQSADPLVIDGRRYVLEVDEFANYGARPNLVTGAGYQADAPVGAARLIDVHDPRTPFVVSNLRLEVHQPEARLGEQAGDPGAGSPTGGYSAHYCSAPRRVDPGIVACSMVLSGLRVFDVSDPYAPREVAYANLPGDGGGAAYSAPAWDLAKRQVWYTDNTTGFHVVRLAKAVVPRSYAAGRR